MSDIKQVEDKLTVNNPAIFIIPAECQIGCKTFSGGEKKHVKECVHYPDSQSELINTLITHNTRLHELIKNILETAEDASEPHYDIAPDEIIE